ASPSPAGGSGVGDGEIGEGAEIIWIGSGVRRIACRIIVRDRDRLSVCNRPRVCPAQRCAAPRKAIHRHRATGGRKTESICSLHRESAGDGENSRARGSVDRCGRKGGGERW